MNKRITSIVLSFVMLFTILATAVPALAATPVELKVTADTTSANPGDTINYKVSIGAVTDMGGLEFKLDIPSGLTIDDSSISIPDGLETIIDSDGPIIVPTSSNKYYWLYSAQLTGYTGTSDLVILTFSCKVDDGTTGTKTVSIKEVVLIDQSVEDMPFNVTGADVNVTIPHAHVYDQTSTDAAHLKTPATCTEAAVYYKSCACGAEGTETFTSGSALGHEYTQKFEDAAHLKTAASNCTEYNVYWYACSRCDANAKDDAEATDKYYTSTTAGNHSFTEKIEDAAHYVDGTGTDCQSVKQYYYDCAYCNLIGTTTWDSTTYGPHNYAATWSSDADGHWHECSLCHGKKDEAAHTPGAAATETTPQKCTECDYIITAALGHTHSLTKVEAKAPTCTEDGNIEYYTCSGCSKLFADATGNVEITADKTVDKATGHQYEWVIDKEATATEKGSKHEECKVCHDKKAAVEIPATGGSIGGGGFIPTVQKPTIEAGEGVKVTLSADGTVATITVEAGYELADVVLNGTSKGKVTEVKGLKTGDKLAVTAAKKAPESAEPTAEEIIATLADHKLAARSKVVTMKNGKKAVRITWYNANGEMMEFDGVEIFRSTKKNSGYGNKPFYANKESKSKGYYINTKDVKVGTTYYYKLRGYVVIDGQKYYTDYSLKAIRTVK